MASYTFTLSGHTSTLSTQIYPPINLSDGRYALGLISFSSYHTIPNVDQTNNKFIFQVADQTRNDIEKTSANLSNKIEKNIDEENKWQVIEIPTGSYEIGDIERFLQKTLLRQYVKRSFYNEFGDMGQLLTIIPNLNTQHINISSSYLNIDFEQEGTIGEILGFSRKLYADSSVHVSDKICQITKLHSIRLDCNIVTGAYYNGKLSHTVFEFPLRVPPGYMITEVPKNIIYLPITSNQIDNITLDILDQDGRQVNFQGEMIVVRLELKRLL